MSFKEIDTMLEIRLSDLQAIETENEELREKNDHLEDKVYHSTRLVEELRLGNLELKRKLEVAKKALSTIADNSANDLSFYAAKALKEIEQ